LQTMTERFFENVICFDNRAIMTAFFEEYSDFYLPRQLWGNNKECYERILNEIHIKRLGQVGAERDSVFLSICIPSHNRGELALESVRLLQETPYDSEIEIIVSDNGSIIGEEAYAEIGKIRDSRVRFFQNEVNLGIDGNVRRVIQLAKGRFIYFLSDEDRMSAVILRRVLNCLYQNVDLGFAYFCEQQEGDIYNSGINAVAHAMSVTYISGLALNNEIIRKASVDKWVEQRKNTIFEWYPHIMYAIRVSCYANSKTYGWKGFIEGKEGTAHGEWKSSEKEIDGEQGINRYMWPEARAEQLKDLVNLLYEICNHQQSEGFSLLVIVAVRRHYHYISTVYRVSPKTYEQRHSWEESCRLLHDAISELFQNNYGIKEKDLQSIRDEWIVKKSEWRGTR